MRGLGVLASARARARCKALAVLASVAVACPMMLAGSASAAAPPAISATPRTDLTNLQTITITGSGFTPGATVGLAQCRMGECAAIPFWAFTNADASGNISRSLTIRTTVQGSATTWSCLNVSCFVSAFQGPSFAFAVGVPIWFRNTTGSVADRAITVTPSSGLVDGQTVAVTGVSLYDGFTPLFECITSPVAACSPATTIATATGDGSFSTTFTVHREFEATILNSTETFQVNCVDPANSTGCQIAVSQGGEFTPEWIYAVQRIYFAAVDKSDCDDGGWTAVVTADGQPFKNQGQCVSHVVSNRGGNAS